MVETPAYGVEGTLIRVYDDETGEMDYLFRLVFPDGSFVDHRIDLDMLDIKILEKQASLYTSVDGTKESVIDYDSETIKKDIQDSGVN